MTWLSLYHNIIIARPTYDKNDTKTVYYFVGLNYHHHPHHNYSFCSNPHMLEDHLQFAENLISSHAVFVFSFNSSIGSQFQMRMADGRISEHERQILKMECLFIECAILLVCCYIV